jgi:hypothetical protein
MTWTLKFKFKIWKLFSSFRQSFSAKKSSGENFIFYMLGQQYSRVKFTHNSFGMQSKISNYKNVKFQRGTHFDCPSSNTKIRYVCGLYNGSKILLSERKSAFGKTLRCFRCHWDQQPILRFRRCKKSSLVRLENKYFLLQWKNALIYYTVIVVVIVNSEAVGLAPVGSFLKLA